jgi:pimeloyl-ACP methyl ester carboxylesterase
MLGSGFLVEAIDGHITFEWQDIELDDVRIRAAIGGEGPPLLLIHGNPQTHLTWHKIAPQFARRYTIVLTDLRGYGDSSKPESDPDHRAYSKRAMAADNVAVMRHLGFERYRIVAHDRGARVAHRLALDFPEQVEKLVLLDIAPTRTMRERTDRRFATGYFWWFFLVQAYPIPEKALEADPDFFLDALLELRTEGLRILRCLNSIDAASAILPLVTQSARIIEHRTASLSSMTKPMKMSGFRLRCLFSGVSAVFSARFSMSSPPGQRRRSMSVGTASIAATPFRRKRLRC